MNELACPIDGWADHPWRAWPGGLICAVYRCYFDKERHHA